MSLAASELLKTSGVRSGTRLLLGVGADVALSTVLALSRFADAQPSESHVPVSNAIMWWLLMMLFATPSALMAYATSG
jgi:hypothetical protein